MVWTVREEAYTVEVSVTKVVDGKEIEEKIPETRTRSIMVADEQASTWRVETLTLPSPLVQVTDTKGNAVSAGQVAILLQQKSPVLVSLFQAPDSFYLLTTNESTLVFIVPPEVIYPPSPPVAPPPTAVTQ